MDSESPEQRHQPTHTIVVVTEVALTDSDVRRMVGLHSAERYDYHVLVPADTERHVMVNLLDHLMLLDFNAAAADLHAPDPKRARTTADEALHATVAAIQAADRTASGVVTEDDPLPALRAEVKATGAAEVVIVTEPHAVEDTFHTDWASRAREEIGLPVLHMYAGDWRLG
ncbi:MAG: hypothetical protein ACOYBY_14110 [Dermatophilaceae bacterium]